MIDAIRRSSIFPLFFVSGATALGAFGTVSVFEVGEGKDLLINCIEEVPDHRDALVLFKVLGHAPMLMHPNPETVLVNAVGGGITLGSVVRHGAEVEAVELVPEVTRAMPLFAEENGNVLRKENWRLIHDDGRNHLRLSPKAYDVITAGATHPAAGERFEAAVDPLETAVSLRPGDPTFLANLVFAYEKSGQIGKALRTLGQLEALAPENRELQDVRRRLEEQEKTQ